MIAEGHPQPCINCVAVHGAMPCTSIALGVFVSHQLAELEYIRHSRSFGSLVQGSNNSFANERNGERMKEQCAFNKNKCGSV